MENINVSKIDQKNNNNNAIETAEVTEAIVFIADDHITTPSSSLPGNLDNPLLPPNNANLTSEIIDGRRLKCIDVTNDNILVALKYRDQEIHELVKLHQDYFDSVRNFIDSKEEWQRFQEILYSKREDINDIEWINMIEEFFKNNLLLFIKFKELVELQQSLPSEEINTTEQTSNEYDSLKSQLEQIFSDFDKEGRGRIISRDLLSMIELFEKNQTTCLLKDDARKIFQMFCEQNPNMEVSVDDVLQLIAKLSAPSNCETAPLSNEQVTTRRPITKFGSVRTGWSNRTFSPPARSRDAPMLIAPDTDNDESFLPSMIQSSHSRRLSSPGYYDSSGSISFHRTYHDISDDFSETSFEASGGIDQSISHLSQTIDDPALQLSKLYRHTVDLTKRLKDSERHLASVARQHEDRIEELQHKLDETKADLQAKKREIQDHKSKEKISSHQIFANLSDQKNLYSHLKKQYEDKYEEAEKLSNIIKLKEEELARTERNLTFFAAEERKWNGERERLETAISKLEQDLTETLDLSDIGSSKDLRTEMVDHVLASIDEVVSDSNTEDIRNDKKNKPRRRKDDTSDINTIDEHAQSRSNNDLDRHRVTDIEQSGRKQSSSRSSRRFVDQSVVARNNPLVETQFQTLSSELGVQYALIEGILRNRASNGNTHGNPHGNLHDKRDRAIRNNAEGDNNELARHRGTRNSVRRNKRRVNPSQEIEAQALEKIDSQSSKALVPRNANNSVHNIAIVHNTATFALYTVVIYLFGIITSVFVIDNNQGAAPYSDWMPYDDLREDGWASRLGQMILYWAEILLNDGNMRVPT
nr:5130_t:CDS:10 [Entrophospora candida]